MDLVNKSQNLGGDGPKNLSLWKKPNFSSKKKMSKVMGISPSKSKSKKRRRSTTGSKKRLKPKNSAIQNNIGNSHYSENESLKMKIAQRNSTKTEKNPVSHIKAQPQFFSKLNPMERISLKSVKSVGHYHNKMVSPHNPLINSVSDLSGGGIRSSNKSGQNFELKKVSNFLPYIQNSYYPSKTLRSASQKARRHMVLNSSQQLISQEYSIHEINNNRTFENGRIANKGTGPNSKILNLNSYKILSKSQNSHSLSKNKPSKSLNKAMKKQEKTFDNFKRQITNIQKLKQSKFVQNTPDYHNQHQRDLQNGQSSTRSIYNKVLNDYALKPSYSSKGAMHLKNHNVNHPQNNSQTGLLYASSPKQVNIHHHTHSHNKNNSQLMRQPIASSFEYGTTPKEYLKHSIERERPNPNYIAKNFMHSSQEQNSSATQQPQQQPNNHPLEGYFYLNKETPKFFEKSGNQLNSSEQYNPNESSFLDKVANEAEYPHQNQQTWNNKVYHKQHPTTMNNNIHINMKFVEGTSGKIVPSKIVLKPKISSQFMKASRTSKDLFTQKNKQISGNGMGAQATKKRRKRSNSRNSRGSKGSRRGKKLKGSIYREKSSASGGYFSSLGKLK